MNPDALHARLAARGYIPVSHGPTDYPEDWLDLDGPAGTVRVVTHSGGEAIEVHGLGSWPARLPVFEVRLSDGAPEAMTVGILNTAEDWLTSRLRP